MIGIRTIRFRLTAAYALILTVMVGGTAAWSWVAARRSVSVTVDRGLERDMTLFQSSVQMTSRRMDIVQAIQMSTTWGVRDLLVRVFDASGATIYQSPSLEHQLSAAPPAVEPGRITFRTVSGNQDEDVRLAATAIEVQNHRYVVELVQPVTIGERSLTRFGRMLMLVIPLALVLASLGGYWLSGRALAPVTQITNDARRINATNLSDRLVVPPAHDELRELSETLNAMLGRIDQSVSQLRQFTADASHELRAPLALIYTAAEFSLRRERPREELVDALEKILRESRHTTSLVDSLLLLARADSGEDSLQAPVSINLSALCQDTADRAAELASAKDISVSTDLGSTSIVVDGDETALRRLLLILVDNAVKYTPARRACGRSTGHRWPGRADPHLGHGYRDRRRGPAARLRPILARRQSANPIGGRHWPRTGDRALDCGPSRRDDCRLERGRSRVRVYGEAAAGTRIEPAGGARAIV